MSVLLAEYRDYYEYANRSALTVVDFREVNEDFLPTVRAVNQRFGCPVDEGLLGDMVQLERGKFQGAVDTLGSSTPNPEKEKLKGPLKEALRTLPDYAVAARLYQELTGTTD